MQEPIIGIDLGTTNSEVAIIQDGQPVVLEEDGDPILPSFVGLSDDGRLLVGKAARNQWVLAPERTIKSIKRKMGQDTKVKLGEQEYRPQEISAMILRALRDRASQQLGVSVQKAVITVPASWRAWRSCGFSTSRRPRPCATIRATVKCGGCSSTISAAAPSTSRSCNS